MNAINLLAKAATQKGVPFLITGGHAVIAHGHLRNTFDLDFIIRRTDRDAWIEIVRGSGYTFHQEGPTFLQFNPLDKKTLPLDLMLVSDETFVKLMADSVPAPGPLAGAKIVSLLHLIALKCHAIKHGHSGRIVKDVDDVINLIKVNRIDVNAAEIRDLLLKHGPQELYEQLQRACSRR